MKFLHNVTEYTLDLCKKIMRIYVSETMHSKFREEFNILEKMKLNLHFPQNPDTLCDS